MSLIDFTVRLLGNNRRSLSADSETQHGSGSYLESYLCRHKGWIFFVVVLFCSNERLDSAEADDFESHILPQSHQEIIPLTTGE